VWPFFVHFLRFCLQPLHLRFFVYEILPVSRARGGRLLGGTKKKKKRWDDTFENVRTKKKKNALWCERGETG
jgi:hypothetical protein